MQKILSFFRPLILINYRHPFSVLGAASILAVVAGYFALQLRIDTDIANLLPETNEHVLALEKLQETVGGETPMDVVIKSPSFEDNKRFAEDLIDRSLELYDSGTDNYFFERAEFRKETDVLKDNALYFATFSELQEITEYLQGEIQGAKEKANPFYIDFGEEEGSESEGEGESDEEKLARFEETYDSIIPSEYPISKDSTVALIRFYPTGSKSNISYLEDMFAAYDSLIVAMNPQSYNEDMEVRYGGRLKRHLNELDSIMNDVFNSFASGISSVVLLVMLYFFIKKYINYRRGSTADQYHNFFHHLIRMPVPVLIIGIPLLISLLWTFGLTYVVLGTLNTMTSVLFVILFGMGIDYGIHFYARYIEFRSTGLNVLDSLHTTYDRTGAAIVVSGLTTSFSLFVLVIARFRGFSEFGYIAGSGIIMALICMLFVLPSLLAIMERFGWILLNENEADHSASTPRRFPFARTILSIGVIATMLVTFNHQHLKFQYEFGELEPEFPEYESFRELANQVSNSNSDRRNPAYILADSQEDVIEIMDTLRARMRADTTSPTILDVEALPERFPPTEAGANEKLERIAKIRQLLDDPFIQGQKDSRLDKLRRAAQTTEPLAIDDIPEYYKNQFVTKEGEVGNFVIVYPSVGLSDGRQSIAFKNDVGQVTLENGKTYYAASTSIIAAEMLELMRSESPWMVGATFLMVFLLMYFSFRSFRWTLIGMLPLVVGMAWLFGIMMLTGLMFNFYNLVVLPAILGIGEDNGVHLAHRYRDEGKNSMWNVLSSTGQHITMASVTTMLGFSGLIFTNHPGLQSLGLMAVIGIGMTLLTAWILLPAAIQWLEDKDWIRF